MLKLVNKLIKRRDVQMNLIMMLVGIVLACTHTLLGKLVIYFISGLLIVEGILNLLNVLKDNNRVYLSRGLILLILGIFIPFLGGVIDGLIKFIVIISIVFYLINIVFIVIKDFKLSLNLIPNAIKFVVAFIILMFTVSTKSNSLGIIILLAGIAIILYGLFNILEVGYYEYQRSKIYIDAEIEEK